MNRVGELESDDNDESSLCVGAGSSYRSRESGYGHRGTQEASCMYPACPKDIHMLPKDWARHMGEHIQAKSIKPPGNYGCFCTHAQWTSWDDILEHESRHLDSGRLPPTSHLWGALGLHYRGISDKAIQETDSNIREAGAWLRTESVSSYSRCNEGNVPPGS